MRHLKSYKIFESNDSLNGLSDKDLIERGKSLTSHLTWLKSEAKEVKSEISQIERILYDRKSTGKYKYPDRLYNHKDGAGVLISNNILTSNLELIDNTIGARPITNDECEYEWYVEKCRDEPTRDFRFVQEVSYEGKEYLLFYTLYIWREHYQDYIEKIKVEKIEPIQ